MRANADLECLSAREIAESPDHPANPLVVEAVESWLRAIHQARRLRDKVRERPSKVFFYPACRFDWQPLSLFSSLCDTFVYCDCNAQPDQLERELWRLRDLDGLRQGAAQRIHLADLQLDHPAHAPGVELSPQQQRAYDEVFEARTARSGWGRQVRLTQVHGTAPRQLYLYYLCAEGYSIYVNLFTHLGVAPRVLCLKGAYECDKNWTQFLRWESPLGLAVATSETPEILVVHRNPQAPTERADNWPWRRPWRTYEGWEAAAFVNGTS